ncbi:TPA: dATP/dGTP pyrophosphohydrolase domain-containing protein [Salmonella enterica subsp. enterica serovar Javiana]
MTTITRERAQEIFLGNGPEPTASEQRELARIALASLEREQVRREHAEWSDKTFGDVGPVGPLKHLSKEALEAAAEPDDLSEWADMQFLLWDAQRRAGISDGEITAAMIEKLEINKSRQWPEPKDGEPRLHIKEQPAPVVPEEMPKGLAGQIVSLLAHNIGDKFLAQKIWNACRATMLQANQRDLSQPVDPQVAEYEQIMLQAGNYPVIPGGWISCSERMPVIGELNWRTSLPLLITCEIGVIPAYYGFVSVNGDKHYGFMESFKYGDGRGNLPQTNEYGLISNVTHWMPLPEPPQEVNRG